MFYFYGLLRGLSLQNISWIFFSNLYIPRWLRKSFKFMMLRLLENTFVSQKMNAFIFTHAPKQNSSLGSYRHHFRQKEITHFPNTTFFENLFSSKKHYGTEKITKIKLVRVLVTSFNKFTVFATFTWFLICCAIL